MMQIFYVESVYKSKKIFCFICFKGAIMNFYCDKRSYNIIL